MDFITGEILYIDKPLEWTSFDVVKRVRGVLLHRLHRKKMKVGHAGTLDPLATGVMVVVTGKSTKLIEQLQAGVKEYVNLYEETDPWSVFDKLYNPIKLCRFCKTSLPKKSAPNIEEENEDVIIWERISEKACKEDWIIEE